jgi:hypothetical protein
MLLLVATCTPAFSAAPAVSLTITPIEDVVAPPSPVRLRIVAKNISDRPVMDWGAPSTIGLFAGQAIVLDPAGKPAKKTDLGTTVRPGYHDGSQIRVA